MDAKELGRLGEELAERELTRRGYRIVARNARLAGGELDLVASQGGDTVFVEVKTRLTDRFGPPQAAVDAAKQRRLTRLALAWLQASGQADARARFDVVSISLDPRTRTPLSLEVFVNAFEAAE